MSLQSLKQFRQHANGNAQVESAVRACFTGSGGALDFEALAALGKRSGFDFSAQDIRTAMASADEELSDLELEVVSAGIAGGGNSGKGGEG